MNSVMFDRAVRLQVSDRRSSRVPTRYRGCTVGATEIADCGEPKAACKSCRMAREDRKSEGMRMATARLRRSQA